MARKERYRIIEEDGTFTIMDDEYIGVRGIATREEADKNVASLIQEDDISEIISDGVDEIIDKVTEKYPEVSRDKIHTMISENML